MAGRAYRGSCSEKVLELTGQRLAINKIARQLHVGTGSVVRTLRMASVSTKQQKLAA